MIQKILVPFDKVVEICEEEDYESLWEHDQLTKERNANSIFSDFNVEKFHLFFLFQKRKGRESEFQTDLSKNAE